MDVDKMLEYNDDLTNMDVEVLKDIAYGRGYGDACRETQDGMIAYLGNETYVALIPYPDEWFKAVFDIDYAKTPISDADIQLIQEAYAKGWHYWHKTNKTPIFSSDWDES